MNNQNENRGVNVDSLMAENRLIRERLELLSSLFDDLSKMYFKLEKDFFLSGKIKEKPSDNGFKYDIYKDD